MDTKDAVENADEGALDGFCGEFLLDASEYLDVATPFAPDSRSQSLSNGGALGDTRVVGRVHAHNFRDETVEYRYEVRALEVQHLGSAGKPDAGVDAGGDGVESNAPPLVVTQASSSACTMSSAKGMLRSQAWSPSSTGFHA